MIDMVATRVKNGTLRPSIQGLDTSCWLHVELFVADSLKVFNFIAAILLPPLHCTSAAAAVQLFFE